MLKAQVGESRVDQEAVLELGLELSAEAKEVGRAGARRGWQAASGRGDGPTWQSGVSSEVRVSRDRSPCHHCTRSQSPGSEAAGPSCGRRQSFSTQTAWTQRSSTFLSPRTGFLEDNFSLDGVEVGGGGEGLSALHVLCTLFLLLLHKLHLRSSDIRFQRLGSPGEGQSFLPYTEATTLKSGFLHCS